MDFGLAIDHREMTSGSSMVGTLAYMAPKLFAEESASIQSDLYTVDIIAYEMFVGTHPFKTNDISQMLNDIFLKTPGLKSS